MENKYINLVDAAQYSKVFIVLLLLSTSVVYASQEDDDGDSPFAAAQTVSIIGSGITAGYHIVKAHAATITKRLSVVGGLAAGYRAVTLIVPKPKKSDSSKMTMAKSASEIIIGIAAYKTQVEALKYLYENIAILANPRKDIKKTVKVISLLTANILFYSKYTETIIKKASEAIDDYNKDILKTEKVTIDLETYTI